MRGMILNKNEGAAVTARAGVDGAVGLVKKWEPTDLLSKSNFGMTIEDDRMIVSNIG